MSNMKHAYHPYFMQRAGDCNFKIGDVCITSGKRKYIFTENGWKLSNDTRLSGAALTNKLMDDYESILKRLANEE